MSKTRKPRPDDLVVFLGPSLSEREARALAPCRVLPPARQGDLWRALAHEPKAVALVDGLFAAVPSVWHHEILAAMQAGVAVFGGASMGALRAAELWREGMIGVGQIFAWYRDGRIRDDSEVALLHAGAGHLWQPFTVPLVNVRHLAERAREEGILKAQEAKGLVEAASGVFYQDRTWERILADVRWNASTRERWQAFAQRGLEDLKAMDARSCIEAAAAFVKAAGPLVPFTGRWPSSLVRRRRLHEGTGSSRVLAALSRRRDAHALTEAGLKTLLLAGWARELGLVASPEEVGRAEQRWWKERGVAPGRRAQHLASMDLDAAERARMFETLALEAKVLAQATRMISDGPSEDEALAFEARRRGLWSETRRR
ncbi:MAG: hypothetical protein HY901_11685 [Deltaproteobacteria bacterium]|nr:hypothetical protein [Deltaproteobacteria bacterium]